MGEAGFNLPDGGVILNTAKAAMLGGIGSKLAGVSLRMRRTRGRLGICLLVTLIFSMFKQILAKLPHRLLTPPRPSRHRNNINSQRHGLGRYG